MKLRTQEIAVAGVLSAIAVLLAVTRLGFIPFFAGISITVMHLPVIIGAVVSGPVVGSLIGLIFGLSSMILASVAPSGPGDVFFTDPLVSVLPRLFIGVAAWGAYRLTRSAGKRGTLAVGGVLLAGVVLAVAYTVGTAVALLAGIGIAVVGLALLALLLRQAAQAHPEGLALSVAAVVGTLTNTLLVLSALVARGYIPGSLALTVGVTNGPPEMVAAAVITVAVIAAWRQIPLRSGRAKI